MSTSLNKINKYEKKCCFCLFFEGVPAMLGLPPPTIPAVQWVVTPAEKLKFDEMFKTADTDKDGFVNGTEIKVVYMYYDLYFVKFKYFDSILKKAGTSSKISSQLGHLPFVHST